MNDKATVFHARKKREIDELRVVASRAFANTALRYLDEAEQRLRAMLPADDGAPVEDLIGRARDALSGGANKKYR